MQKKSKTRQLLVYVLPFIFILSVFTIPVYSWNPFKTEAVWEPAPPTMKLYAKCEPVQVAFGARSLSAKGGDINAAKNLYDGDKGTVFTSGELAEVTLDLGRNYMLSGVRFIPVMGETEKSINRCIGTRFYVSRDNRSFTEAAVAEPVDGQNYSEELKELMFGSSGEFRYVKVSIPAGAMISEIQWLEYPEWTYNRQDMNLKLHAFDIQKEFSGDVVAAIYNPNGVLKNITKTEQTFTPENSADVNIAIKGVKRETGDSYRIAVWEKDGSLAVQNVLTYRYADAESGFSVANVFSDNMMLQRNKPLIVWGKAPVKSTVEVALTDESGAETVKSLKAEKSSDWEIDMGSFPEGGSYTMTVRCGTGKRIYKNITFGDVWLLAGQSNIEYYMLCGDDTAKYLKSKEGKQEAENPDIRLLNLWNKGTGGAGGVVNNLPVSFGETVWTAMNRDAANYCSAIGYYFAQELQNEYHIPIGLISAAVGDTEINRWLPRNLSSGSFTSTDGDLYNNRISPLSKLNICGILWYQGEADEYYTQLTAAQYRDAMVGLVEHYREIWGSDLPFYWAQLTRYGNKDASMIREGQRLALEKLSNQNNAGMISLMDIYGEYKGGTGSCRDDIHPHQKKEAAERFALLAKRDVYGEKDIAATGPLYKSMTVTDDGKIELTFKSTGDLLVMPKERYADKIGDKLIEQNQINTMQLQEFEIAGDDGFFMGAHAEIQGNKVVVWSNKIAKPVNVRYAWGGYPEMPNLTDGSGLPAASFSTEVIE